MSVQKKTTGKIDFKEFVDVFNTHGKKAAIKYVSEKYDVKYDTIVNRLRLDSEYSFDQSRDRYYLKSDKSTESPFLTVEELCNNEKPRIQLIKELDSGEIIANLIKDKFFEISKYVILENSSKKLFLKIDAAKSAGYDIEYI